MSTTTYPDPLDISGTAPVPFGRLVEVELPQDGRHLAGAGC